MTLVMLMAHSRQRQSECLGWDAAPGVPFHCCGNVPKLWIANYVYSALCSLIKQNLFEKPLHWQFDNSMKRCLALLHAPVITCDTASSYDAVSLSSLAWSRVGGLSRVIDSPVMEVIFSSRTSLMRELTTSLSTTQPASRKSCRPASPIVSAGHE